jgi:DNA polymerase-1
VVARARACGYLQTLSGRRRWLPHINSPDWEKRGHAERVAVNNTCQGSAADIVKGAMVQLSAALWAAGLSAHCRLLVQVRAR